MNTSRSGRSICFLRPLFLAAWMILVASSAAAEDAWLDNISYMDPKFTIPPKHNVFAPRLKELWLEALSRPEADLKRQAADAISRAKQLGMQDLSQTIKPLIDTLDSPDVHPLVSLSVARALIVLDAKEAAPVLFEQTTTGSLQMAQLITPTLVRWHYPRIQEALRSRINEAAASRERVVLALRGLAELKDIEAVARMRELALDPSQSSKLRLEAALALGQSTSTGLTKDAERLSADNAPYRRINRLIAVRMLSGHGGKTAQVMLLKLAADPEPAVAVIALERLLEIDHGLVIPLVKRIMSNRDPNVRAIAVVAMRERPTSEHVEMLIGLLNDPSPRVRTTAREALHILAAREEYHRQIRRLAMQLLETEAWRATEQAAILLGMLDHKPAAKPLIRLLQFHRPETFIPAAWAIKKLGVPDFLPDVLEVARKRTSYLKTPGPRTFQLRVDIQLSQLFQLFGKLKYAPAESLLREFIPRGPQFRFESRATAIWALGRMHIDDPKTDLTPAFIARLKDVMGTIVEDPRIRRMAAVSLGRMKADSALDELERFYKAGDAVNLDIRDVGYACAWAIRRITAKNVPDPPIPDDLQQGWFLEPIDGATSN